MTNHSQPPSIPEQLPLPCAEKLAFDTVKEARAAATTAQWRYGAKLKVYKCRYCRLYHLSSNFDE